MFDTLLSLLALIGIGMAAFGVGRPVVRALALETRDPLAISVWSLGIGLVLGGLSLACLGLVGGLYETVIRVLTLTAGFWGVGELAQDRSLWREWLLASIRAATDEPEHLACTPPAASVRHGLLALAVIAACGALVCALAPPTAGDALCYHLELPKCFLEAHSLVFLHDSDNATFPLLAEMWYLWALALDGGVAAQLVHWSLGILWALSLVVLATPILGRPWSWCAGGLLLLVPGVTNQMTAPLNDAAHAWLTTLALAAWWQAVIADAHPRWYLVAGMLLGGALGTKYLALIFALALAVPWLVALVRQPLRRGRLLAGAATVAVVAASVGGLWYVRAAWFRGNPVYPFFDEYVNGTGRATLPTSKSSLGRGPLALATAGWQVTMHPERFGGRGHQLGLLLLLTLPALPFVRRLRGLGTLLVVAGCYGVGWFLLRQNVRFLLPTLAPLMVAAGWVLAESRRFPRPARLVSTGLIAGWLVACAVLPWHRARPCLAVAVGLESRHQYLERSEPTYGVATWANQHLSRDARVLSQEHRAFYFQAHVTRENIYRRRTRYHESIAQGKDLVQALREQGFTHLLLADTATAGGIHYNSTLSQLVDSRRSAATPGKLANVHETRFVDRDGTTRRYRLVELR